MADYPVTKKDFTTKINDEDPYDADDINEVQTELRAVIDFIGTAKAEQLSLLRVLQGYRQGKGISVVSGDTVSFPASEIWINERGCRNTAAFTRDLADDIAASTNTDYYLFAVDDADGTFSLEFRTAATSVSGKRNVATVHSSSGDATVISTIVDDDIFGTDAPHNFSDEILQRPVLKDYAETLVEANTSTTYTINFENGNVFELTLTGNVTYTFSNSPANNIGGSFTLIQKQDATGSRTVTWPASVKWASGSAPTVTAAASSIDVFTFITTDGGASWYGFTGGQNFS